MPVKDDLEIFIITYNRSQQLEETLRQLLSKNSPVKDFDIKILDNCSTDNTKNTCKIYQNIYPNITYIQNNRNIGAVGNVIKAMELVSKKWLWILGDDDNYNWEAWPEIELALNQNYDIVNTCWHGDSRSEDYSYLLNESGFIATSIYNTKHINDITMQNALYLSKTLNPHSAITTKVINEKGRIFVPSQKMVIEYIKKDSSALRPQNINLLEEVRNYNVFYQTLNIYQLLLDEEQRHKCNEVLWLGQSFKFSMLAMINQGINWKNLIEVFFMLSNEQKIQLLEILIPTLGINQPNMPINKMLNFDTLLKIKETFDSKSSEISEIKDQIKDLNKKFEEISRPYSNI